ncbi:MAG: N-acetylmuramoyl-L-alanine amidase [Dokdonella sp.]
MSAAEIRSVRSWASPEYTRVVFDLSGPADYKLFDLSDPDRVVLDLRNSSFVEGFTTPEIKGLLKSVRVGKQGKTDARAVFNLGDTVRPKSFLLAPDSKSGHRLVLDFYPKTSVATPVKKLVDALPKDSKGRKVLIAIDAGHGGKDPGAIGASGSYEKNLTLKVARELKQQIDREPGMSAMLIRDSDVYIVHKQRYEKARKAKADLFVSIHADACPGSCEAQGSSVWVMSPRGATSESAKLLADRENRSDLIGGVQLDDKDADLAAVLIDLQQGATMGASNAVADQVLAALRQIGPTHRSYVERANFIVLRSPDVPSILVETAFISNPIEENRLMDSAHREKLAKAIIEGARNYFRLAPPDGTQFAQSADRPKPSRHVVSAGESLSIIATRHSISVDELRSLNKLSSNTVRVGEVLRIPTG